MSEVKSFLVRLPVGLHSRISGVAERERRSMQSVVLLALESAFGAGVASEPVKRKEAPRSSPKDGGGGKPEVKPAKAPVVPSVGHTDPRPWSGPLPKTGKGKK